MRPRYLEVEGLQSFKEAQSIDFDRLGETGIFGIFGPTGSGKSTILDAITLALYGNVQRANRGTQGIINTHSTNVKVSFTFDLLKEGTRKTYKVERLYKRKKDSENSAEIKMARLFDVSGDAIMADKPGEVNEKVIELLGLQLDDFTRSVVLPQNKFQEFLMLDKAKKRDMMERIFYLEEYGRQLTEKVNRKLTAIKFKLSNIEGAISTLGDASEKALIEAESRMKAARESRERLDGELKLAELEFNRAREVWEAVNDLNFLEQKEIEHLNGLEETGRKKRLYENSIKAGELSALIKKFREAVKNLSETNGQMELINSQLPLLEKQLYEAREQYEGKAGEVKKEIPLLIELKHKLMEALGVKKEMTVIDEKLRVMREDYAKIRDQIAAKDNEIKDSRLKIDESEVKTGEHKIEIEKLKVNIDYRKEIQSGVSLEDEVHKIREEKDSKESEFNKLSEKVSKLEKDLKELEAKRQAHEERLGSLKVELQKHVSAKPGDRNGIMEEMNLCHGRKRVFESLKSKKADLDKLGIRFEASEKNLRQQESSLAAVEEKKNNLEARLNSLVEQGEGLKNRLDKNAAYMLAQKLAEGEPCPVCGSLHHPVPAAGVPKEDVEVLEKGWKESLEQQEKLQKELRESEKQYIKLKEQLKSQQGQYDQLQNDLLAAGSEYLNTAEQLPQFMREMQLGEMEAELKGMEDKNSFRLKALDEWEKALEGFKVDIQEAEGGLSKLRIEEGSKRTEFEVTGETLVQLRKSLEEAVKNFNSKSEAYSGFIGKHGIKNAREEMERIENSDRRIEQLQREMEQLQESSKAARGRLEQLIHARQELESKRVEIENDGKNLRLQKDEKEQKVRQLAGDRDIEQELVRVEETSNLLQQQEKRLLEAVKILESEYNKAATRKSTLEKQLEIYMVNKQQEEAGLNEALKLKGFESMEAAENALISPEEQEKLVEDIREFEERGKKLAAQKHLIEVKLDGRTMTEEQWNQISEGFQLKKQEKEDSIAAFESSRNIYIMVKNNFDSWLRLNGELQEHSRKKEMLEQIQKLLKGNSFVEFISEERLRYVAKEASETLGLLTKYRYAIELDTENGFVIRDNANGGVIRLVSSLSGGETFLTSLSLALALSKQIQLKGQSPLEFFFLDEGFGTLDNNLLDTVIDSLERLSTKERVIGLISHVPELKSRIPRRLVIEPPAGGESGSRVRIEKA